MIHTSRQARLARSTSALALAAILTPALASAGAFQVNERSTKSQGMSFADSVSGAKDVTYGLFNPAALSKVANIEMGGNISIIAPISDGSTSDLLINESILTSGTFNPSAPQVPSPVPASALGFTETTDSDRSAVVPSFALGYRVTDELVLGFGTRTPFGLSTENPNNFIGATDGIQSSLLTVEAQFTASYNVLPNLALAGSLNVFYIDARLTSTALILDGDTIEVGFSAGALWEPFDGTSVGVAYHHGYDVDIDDADITFASGFPPTTPLGNIAGTPSEGTVSASLPASLQIGITQEITPDLRASVEGRWIDWSVFDSIDVDEDEFGFTAADPQDYDDAFFVAAGIEYDVRDDTSVRFGIAYDETPTQDFGEVEGRTVRVPDEDRVWFSIGASHDMNMFGHDMTIDAAYSYLHALDDPEVVIRDGAFAGSTVEYEAGAHIISIGGSLRF